MCALYGRDANPAWKQIWTSALSDVPYESLGPAFIRVEQTFIPTAACPFPTPAHLRAFLDKAKEITSADRTETAWHCALEQISRFYHPDVGWKGPVLSDHVGHALRAANGIHYVSQCSEEELIWAKKRFIECYERDDKLPESQRMLGYSDAKSFLAEASRKALPK